VHCSDAASNMGLPAPGLFHPASLESVPPCGSARTPGPPGTKGRWLCRDQAGLLLANRSCRGHSSHFNLLPAETGWSWRSRCGVGSSTIWFLALQRPL